MPPAGRVGDPIAHSEATAGLLAGALLGAVAAVAVDSLIAVAAGALEVATLGAATPVVCGAIAAGAFLTNMIIGGAVSTLGEDIGEALGSSCMGPPCGSIISGSPNVFINGRPAARVHDPVSCVQHGSPDTIAQGSSTVFINGLPAATVGDKLVCGGGIIGGSNNVIIGGAKITVSPIRSEVSPWAQRLALLTTVLVPEAGGVGAVLHGAGEKGLEAVAKAGERDIAEAIEDGEKEIWTRPYADKAHDQIKFKDFRTKKLRPDDYSASQADANEALDSQGWPEDTRSQVIDSGLDQQIVPCKKDEKFYGFSSSGFKNKYGVTILKGSDPDKPSAYWFHESQLSDIKAKYWNEDTNSWDSVNIKKDFALPCFNDADQLHVATLKRDVDNAVTAKIDQAYENYDVTLPNGKLASGAITLPGGQMQITVPSDSLGNFGVAP